MRLSLAFSALLLTGPVLSSSVVAQQIAPEIGYMFPPGGKAGTTVDVTLGGYDWTPDVEVFVREPRIGLALTGPPGPVIVPEPPYWFEKKARRPPFPMPREFPAQLQLPPDLAPGIYRWQAGSANGASASGRFVVSQSEELVEEPGRRGPQTIASLPATVSGQVLKIEEVDRYRFTALQSGPFTCTSVAAAIGSPLRAVLEIRDAAGNLVADTADTEGRDVSLTFAAEAGADYVVSLYDLDFRGNRSFVYRLSLVPGPRVVAALPAAGPRGETREVEFVGYGLASGSPRLESITAQVAFPAEPDRTSFTYRLVTPFGAADRPLHVTDLPEAVEPAAADSEGTHRLTIPAAITGILETRYGEDRYQLDGTKGDRWALSVQAEATGSPLDVSFAVVDAEGKELARGDDLPGTTDAGLEFTVPADGTYRIFVGDTSGRSGDRAAVYRLVLVPASAGFTLAVPERIGVPLGGTASLAIKAARTGGFHGPIAVALEGLPAGVTASAELVIPEGKNDLAVTLTAAAAAGTAAGFVRVTGRAQVEGADASHTPEPVLLAVTMKPPFTVDAEGKDDVTKWPRGTTFPAPVRITREDGFQGEIVLEMTSKQGRHRQGIRGPELTVPPGTERVLYPVFLPEWLETTRTSRMVLNGVAQVADPKGRVRYLSSKLKTRIGFLPGGAQLTLGSELPELEVPAGRPFEFPVTISRAVSLREPVRLELVLDEELRGLTAEPLTVGPDQTNAVLTIVPGAGARLPDEFQLTARATALQDGHLPVVSEAHLAVAITPQVSSK